MIRASLACRLVVLKVVSGQMTEAIQRMILNRLFNLLLDEGELRSSAWLSMLVILSFAVSLNPFHDERLVVHKQANVLVTA